MRSAESIHGKGYKWSKRGRGKTIGVRTIFHQPWPLIFVSVDLIAEPSVHGKESSDTIGFCSHRNMGIRKSINKSMLFICIILKLELERGSHFPRCQVNFMLESILYPVCVDSNDWSRSPRYLITIYPDRMNVSSVEFWYGFLSTTCKFQTIMLNL